MTPFVFTALSALIVFLAALLFPCVWRVLRGPSLADRLQAIDTLTNIMIGIVVLVALLRDSPMLFSVAIGLAAFSFVGTISLARYVGSGRIF
jgi:multisubunit Na+/H+ antiporter MnhF subunit